MEDAKKEVSEYFKNLDGSFPANLDRLITAINQRGLPESMQGYVKLEQYDEEKYMVLSEEFQRMLFSNQGVDPNLIVKTCIEFYDSINPEYGNMARNILAAPNLMRFKLMGDEMGLGGSSNTMTELNQNYSDIPVLAHEVAHEFTLPTLEKEAPAPELVQAILEETSTIAFEYLASDYVREKLGVNMDAMEMMRVIGFYTSPSYNEAEDVSPKDITDLMEFANNGKSNLKPEAINILGKNKNIKRYASLVCKDFIYYIGTLLANHIYLKIKENPENIKMLDNILTALAKSGAYQEEMINLLEQNGIPIAHNGKISLNEKDMEILYDDYFKRFGKYYGLENSNIENNNVR